MWVKKCLDVGSQGKWKIFFDLELDKYGGTVVFSSNLNKKDITKSLEIKCGFMREVLSI